MSEPATKFETVMAIGGIALVMAFSFGAGAYKGSTHEMKRMKALKQDMFVSAMICAAVPDGEPDSFACRQLGEFATRSERK